MWKYIILTITLMLALFSCDYFTAQSIEGEIAYAGTVPDNVNLEIELVDGSLDTDTNTITFHWVSWDTEDRPKFPEKIDFYETIGEYGKVRAYLDLNGNQKPDSGEPYDEVVFMNPDVELDASNINTVSGLVPSFDEEITDIEALSLTLE